MMAAALQHHQNGNFPEAETLYRQVLDVAPGHFDALHMLGVLAHQAGYPEDAVKYIGKAVRIDKKHAAAFNHLGAAYRALGQLQEAEKCYRSALKLNYDFAEAHYNLANLLTDLKRFKEAEAAYKKAIKFKTDYAEAYCNLGAVLVELGKLSEAEKTCLCALENKQNYAAAYYNLGRAKLKLGKADEAEQSYRLSIKLQPDNAEAYCNLMFAMNYFPKHTALDLLTLAKKYGVVASRKVKKPFSFWHCSADPKVLRVGIVSGDIGEHPVGYFLEGLLSNIDAEHIEFIAYSTVDRTDVLSACLKRNFVKWQLLSAHSDEEAAKLIWSDGIHILLDLSGHTENNRLPMFAWKPAPVQVTWLGYSGTTGLEQMDYVVGDPCVMPDSDKQLYVEKVWQLPESYLCFTPPKYQLSVAKLPAAEQGALTFGCFNNLAKINGKVIKLWSCILEKLPASKLFLRNEYLSDPAACENIVKLFGENGIDSCRLILEGKYTARVDMFNAYNGVDIALDPFPYNGTTTTVESLWMGVPVLTLRGDHFVSRVGVSILANVGLTDWIAADEDDYVAKAVRFASDIEGLARLRSGLRQQLLASPVCDAPRFARHFEDALWGMWREYEKNSEASWPDTER